VHFPRAPKMGGIPPQIRWNSSDLRNVGRILPIRQEAKFEEFLEFVSGCKTRRHGRAPGRYREPFRRVIVPVELAVVGEKFCRAVPHFQRNSGCIWQHRQRIGRVLVTQGVAVHGIPCPLIFIGCWLFIDDLFLGCSSRVEHTASRTHQPMPGS
jgi:hypothetical protein